MKNNVKDSSIVNLSRNFVQEIPNRNFVAKYARQFNKAQVFDTDKVYKRCDKHRNSFKGECPYLLSLL